MPRLVVGVDLTQLPLSPLEGFVLSRVDGMNAVTVLADLTNLAEDDVEQILEKLIGLGAVEWARESVSLPRATGRAPRTPSSSISVPESLRNPPSPRSTSSGRIRILKPAAAPPEGDSLYRGGDGGEEVVEPQRRSASPPRSSHTGSMFPPGELDDSSDDLGTADTMPPPPPPAAPLPHGLVDAEALLDEAGALLAEAGALVSASTPPDAAPVEEPVEAAPVETVEAAPIEDIESAPVEAASEATPAEEPPPDDDDAVDPRDLAAPEDVDLPEERRRRIDDLYYAIDLLDHYQVLGIARDADKKDVRAAYFQLSKVFHPDTMFRKRLGTYKAKMEAIFRRLTEAYEVLGKKRARQDYDRYLAVSDRTRAVEATLDEPDPDQVARELSGLEAAQAEAAAASGRASEAPPSNGAPAPATSPARRSPEAMARTRELMAQKLRRAARMSSAVSNRSVRVPHEQRQPSDPPPRAGRDEVLRGLATTLRDSAHRTGLDPVKRHVLNAERAEREGKIAEAAQELRIAMTLAPERQDLRAHHARLNAELTSSLAISYEEQALYEQRHGKWGAAAISWAKVFEGRPTDARAARFAAEALVEAKGDLHKARELAQKAAELEPDDVESLRSLARVYIAAGLPLNARRVLQHAAKLDPSDEMVENLLRDLGG